MKKEKDVLSHSSEIREAISSDFCTVFAIFVVVCIFLFFSNKNDFIYLSFSFLSLCGIITLFFGEYLFYRKYDIFYFYIVTFLFLDFLVLHTFLTI
jgi:hypothetical protein